MEFLFYVLGVLHNKQPIIIVLYLSYHVVDGVNTVQPTLRIKKSQCYVRKVVCSGVPWPIPSRLLFDLYVGMRMYYYWNLLMSSVM